MFYIFSSELFVDFKKVKAKAANKNETMSVRIIRSKFPIYFAFFEFKYISNISMVGGHKPIKIARS